VDERRETAGFRNAGWTMGGLPEGTVVSVLPLKTLDGAATNCFLYARGRPRTVVCIMHPREFLASHYMVPALVEAGFAAFAQAPRSVGSDLRLEHEIALLDVAAGMSFLRESGFERVVLLGNSGGAGLYAFYNQQSLLAPADRIARTPAGRPTRLADAVMPVADAMVLLSPHPGQGALLMAGIDPSVVEEGDPMSVDPSLDPFDPTNGYADDGARYDPAFLERYRRAQRDRIVRLDASARAMVERRREAARQTKEGRSDARRAAAYQEVFCVWRTDADPRAWDLSLDPSDRRRGSLWGSDPFKSNWGGVGFGRICTPESWLSTWSGLTSNATMARCGPAIEQPTLMVEYTGDQAVFPGDVDEIFDAIGAPAKDRLRFRGDHHGQPIARGEPAGREAAAAAITEWIGDTVETRHPLTTSVQENVHVD